MPKYARKNRKPRRRLQAKGKVPTKPSFAKIVRDVAPLASKAYGAYKSYKRSGYAKRSAIRSDSLLSSDNITTLAQTSIGVPKKLSFSEKVARVERPPIMFKRNYQFSAECPSGRKAWFNIGFNHHSNDINQDITTYKMNLTSDTSVLDDTVTTNSAVDRARFYVDYMSSKLQFMNSSTNALTGKIHLFAYKRDCMSTYANGINLVPINPVNLMQMYSTNAVPLYSPSYESTTTYGWYFNTSGTDGYNMTANYNMPGSSLNATGRTALTDLALSPLSSHIKKDIGFWFRRVSSQSFSLKPGQQLNKVFKFHDLPEISREQTIYEYFNGVTYCLAVEFQGQIVGDSTVTTGDNVISTGSAQLSVIREDIRILGQKNGLKPKVMLQTIPLTGITNANQYIINPDTGVAGSGYSGDA